MRPGLWWWHCCRAQRLSGVQGLSRSTGGLYSHPATNLSWDQVFLFNQAPSVFSSLTFFCYYCFSKKHSRPLQPLKGIKLLVQLHLFLLFFLFQIHSPCLGIMAENLWVFVTDSSAILFHFVLYTGTSITCGRFQYCGLSPPPWRLCFFLFLFVCLFVSRIMQRALNWLAPNFLEWWGMSQEPIHFGVNGTEQNFLSFSVSVTRYFHWCPFLGKFRLVWLVYLFVFYYLR